MKQFSIIIPTFNNRSYKHSCLPKLLDLMLPSADVIEEVVVVDNASTDGGFLRADFDEVRLNVQLEKFPERNNRAAARNFGASLARAPFLVFLDDDMIVPGKALLELADETHENAFWTCARRRYLPLHVDIERATRAAKNLDLDWLNSNSEATPGGIELEPRLKHQLLFAYVACFGIVPRSVFERVGGFNDQFSGWGCEYVELVSRLLAYVPLMNLFNRYVTFHLDHVVSPYKRSESKIMQQLLWKILRDRDQMFDAYRFAEVATRGEDIPKTYYPFPKGRRIAFRSQ